ncbi:MAG: nucleoside-diphosphate sugar epimerase, partial [Bryobacteraceae bacterium]
EATGAGVDIEYIPYERAYKPGFEDIERRVPDIAKVTALTGYRPRVDLEEALRRMVEAETAAGVIAKA